jgi:LPS-assembly protein
MIKICWYGPLRVISLALILTCAFFPAPLYAAEDGSSEVHIDADSVVYQENTGIATADGNVKVRSKTLRLFAPHVEYNSNNQLVEAFSDERGKVDLFSGPDRLTGNHLTYSLETRRGVLTDASGKMEALYMQGNDVRVMPMEDAVKFGVLKSRLKRKRPTQRMSRSPSG